MLTRIYVAGEDAAHTNFVRGFIKAYDFPSSRIEGDLGGLPSTTGVRGDGKALLVESGAAAARQMSRKKHLSTLLIVIHDLDGAEVDDLRSRLMRQIAEKSQAPEEWLKVRSLVLMPHPETEGWIAQIVTSGPYRPENVGQKLKLKKRAFEAGREVGRRCKEGRSSGLPDQMRSFCEAVSRQVEGLQ